MAIGEIAQATQQPAAQQSGMQGSPNQAFDDPTAAVQGAFSQPLNQTGLQQQMASMNQQTAAAAGAPPPGGGQPPSPQAQMGTNSVQALAKRLASGYGMSVGKDNIVDDQGNFLMTPDQMAAQSGMDSSTAAANMNYLSQAISRHQNEQQQAKGVAALQTGLGQVQSNARGSLASMQSGFYQDLADMYSNKEYAAADFSYFIQRDQEAASNALQAQQQKQAEKSGTMGAVIGGATTGAAVGGPVGALIGGALGFASKWF